MLTVCFPAIAFTEEAARSSLTRFKYEIFSGTRKGKDSEPGDSTSPDSEELDAGGVSADLAYRPDELVTRWGSQAGGP